MNNEITTEEIESVILHGKLFVNVADLILKLEKAGIPRLTVGELKNLLLQALAKGGK